MKENEENILDNESLTEIFNNIEESYSLEEELVDEFELTEDITIQFITPKNKESGEEEIRLVYINPDDGEESDDYIEEADEFVDTSYFNGGYIFTRELLDKMQNIREELGLTV